MRTKMILFVFMALFGVISIARAPITQAQSGGTYELTWITIDGGGETFSAGGTYELGGTIGQPDAGAMSGGTYALGGGFWGWAINIASTVNKIFLPMIFK